MSFQDSVAFSIGIGGRVIIWCGFMWVYMGVVWYTVDRGEGLVYRRS